MPLIATNEIHYISYFRIDDIDSLMESVEATASITDVIIEDNRRRHVTLLLSERGSWIDR